MDINKLTEKTKALIGEASNIATQNRNAEITDFHMMAAMLNNENNLIYKIFESNLSIDVGTLKTSINTEISALPKVEGSIQLMFSKDVENQLAQAEKIAESMKDEYISVEHIMLGIIDRASPRLNQYLRLYRIDKKRFLNAL